MSVVRARRGEGNTRLMMRKFENNLAGFGGLLAAATLVLTGCPGPQQQVKKEEPLPKPVATTTPTEAPKPKPPPPPPEPTVAEKLAKAKKAYAAKDWAGARQGFTAVLQKDPKNVEALLLTAVSFDQEGKLDDAIEAYKALLAVDPQNEGALLNLGMVYRRRERFEDAIKLYTKALEADPDNVKLRNNLGVVYRLAKKYDDSEKTLRRVLARSPGNIDAYKNMAVLFLDQNKLALAEQFSIEARKLDEAEDRKSLPKDSGIWNNLGLIYFKKDEGKPTRAMSAFRKAAELNPNDAAAQMNIGAIAMRYRDYATAEKSFQKATELEPNNPEAFLAYGYALDGGHKMKDALAAYGRAEELYGKERCDISWQLVELYKWDATNGTHEYANWGKANDNLTKYKAMSCAEAPADKVEADVKTIAYYLKNPPAPNAPQVGQAPAPAPSPAPAPAPEAAPEKKEEAPAPAPAPATSAEAGTAPQGAAPGAGGGTP